MKMKTWIVALFCLFISTLSFQNCSGLHPLDYNSSDADGITSSDYIYPYTSTPAFYYDIAAYRPALEGSALSQIQIQVAAQYFADATATLNYKVDVLTLAGAPVCPENSGTLIAGLSTIQFTCVSATGVGLDHFKVQVALTAAGTTGTFERDF